MQPLIKITSVPMQTVRYTQNARLVSSNSVDIERRKALARQMSFSRNAGRSTVAMKDITKINRTFSRRHLSVSSKGQTISREEAAFHQVQSSAAQMNIARSTPSEEMIIPNIQMSDPAIYTNVAVVPTAITGTDFSMENTSSYTAERGSLEMRVAKGELTFLPPMVMTIVTQYPELHFEYLGDFNYIPPLNSQTGGNINLFM